MSEFPSFAGSAIEAIRINAISREVRSGRALLVKRRRPWSGLAARAANTFFRAARCPVFVWEKVADWQRWETTCFNLLHAGEPGDAGHTGRTTPRYQAFTEGARTVCFDVLPGTSLAQHFVNRSFSPAMLDAAARELQRAHALRCEDFAGGWSHGDANLANFLFAAAENRARLIDFEIVHRSALSAEERHAQDLLVFLQDLLGCAREDDWLPFAERFLNVYGHGAAVDRLRQLLVIPRGVPHVWWWIRTNYVPASVLRRRVSALRWALG